MVNILHFTTNCFCPLLAHCIIRWVPDLLVPLAYDRASESKVGVFYARLGERTGNNDHLVVRILNKDKRNLTMYRWEHQ